MLAWFRTKEIMPIYTYACDNWHIEWKHFRIFVCKHLHNRRSHLFPSCTPQSPAHPLCRLDVGYKNKLLEERGTHCKGIHIKCIINNTHLKGEKKSAVFLRRYTLLARRIHQCMWRTDLKIYKPDCSYNKDLTRQQGHECWGSVSMQENGAISQSFSFDVLRVLKKKSIGEVVRTKWFSTELPRCPLLLEMQQTAQVVKVTWNLCWLHHLQNISHIQPGECGKDRV